jgi:DeoR/GlpR family transcriptional regulator of sugar metabolism
LRKQSGLRIPELARILDISEGTVRNDLNILEVEGELKRVHGGAVVKDLDPFKNNSFLLRFEKNVAAKLAIAQAAATFVNDGDSILLDASSTTYHLGLQLSNRRNLRVITNGFEVARELAKNPSNTIVLLGGVVNNDSYSVTGLLSEQIIAEMSIEMAFVSCSGFSLERGMTEVHFAEAQLKRKGVESSQQVIALIDSTKFGREDLTPFVRADQITHLISDSNLSSEWIEKIKKTSIDFKFCDVD